MRANLDMKRIASIKVLVQSTRLGGRALAAYAISKAKVLVLLRR
jgi:hypothetical protein